VVNAAERNRSVFARSHWRRWRVLYVLLAVCVAPVLASYLAYYVVPPGDRTNYGDLVQPQRPIPALALRQPDDSAFETVELRGRWVMLHVDAGECAETCQQKLWQMRQLRLTAGKERDRIERVFLIIDETPLQTLLLREFEGTLFLRARSAELRQFLALPETPDATLFDHLWLLDPLGNQMLRWPREADPNRMKRDLGRLLKASQIG